MIAAVHGLIYAEDAHAARAFFRDVLGWPHVDAHDGWLIFALPPAELGVHPAEPPQWPAGRNEIYLMCHDIAETVAELKAKGVEFTGPVQDLDFGLLTHLRIPGGGGELGLYQPKHLSPLPEFRGSDTATSGV